MEKVGKICVLDDDKVIFDLFHRDSLKEYEVFVTSNVYQFFRYAQEMSPDFLMLNLDMEDINGTDVLKALQYNPVLKNIPVMVMINPENFEDIAYSGVSHYFPKPISLAQMTEVWDVYCRGKKKYDVLLIDRYEIQGHQAAQVLRQQNLTFFEAHDLIAAKHYLRKNFPRAICVCMPYGECQRFEDELNYDKIFYVENPQNLKNIATLLA